jgi:hypothetical protein
MELPYKYQKLMDLIHQTNGFIICSDLIYYDENTLQIIKKYNIKPVNGFKYRLDYIINNHKTLTHKINWPFVSQHPSSLDILKENTEEIHINPIILFGICLNPNPEIVKLLDSYLDEINNEHWDLLSQNPSAIDLIEKNIDKINYIELSKNPHPIAIQILENNIDLICWYYLSGNPGAIKLLKRFPEKIVWSVFSDNTSKNALPLFEANFEKLNWEQLLLNPSAIPLLVKKVGQFERNDWHHILFNPSVDLFLEQIDLDKYFGCINFHILSSNHNPRILDFIMKHYNKINEYEKIAMTVGLLLNPAFFQFDYQQMNIKRSKTIYIELISKAFHPSRVSKWLDYHLDNGGDISTFEYV